MIQRQIKLRLTPLQERQLTDWLWHLSGVWNWAVRKLELDAKDGVYYTPKEFHNLLANHSKTLGIPSHTLQGMLSTAYTAWQRCWKKLAKKPKLKGQRNRLNSIPFSDPFRAPEGNYIHVPGIGLLRFHKQVLPDGKIKCGRIVKRASGWYLCLFIDAEPNPIPHVADGEIGIDPGFTHLLTLSTGEKIDHPRELEHTANCLAQAQRGRRKKLTARLQERLSNRRKDRNHKLSRRLVAENKLIIWSKDSHRAIAKTHGKSVASSSHAQLRGMLAYKCRAGGRQYLEVPSRFSTKTCSACGSLSGPTGFTGLRVRAWECAVCGTAHDRDINAAINTLRLGLGISHERRCEAASGIPRP
ncbi:MAG TPA: transposase [Alphaproteobacteria bacterium]|nr:transposase [Alphaproteobacteria bacterium]